jgi:ATP-dependent DNA ligase
MRDGIQLSEAITGDGATIFRHACGLGLEGIVSKRNRLPLRERSDQGMAEDEILPVRG